MPSRLLAELHATPAALGTIPDPHVSAWLADHPIPTPQVTIGSPLFTGTLVFVQMIYNRPAQSPFGLSLADVQTATSYATSAVLPIQPYASQYGANAVSVMPTVLGFGVNHSGDVFNDGDVQGWVDQIVSDSGLTDACIVMLHDSFTPGGPVNSDAGGSVAGYHLRTDNGHPYCFCRVFGGALTVEDRPNIYAQTLSHEIAEMVVDPQGDLSNPEVCDACAGNCNNDQFDLFDAQATFLGGTTNVRTTPMPYAFFINSIVRPELYNPST